MTEVLIDTDVVLDLLLDRTPFSEPAALIFSLCERQQIRGYITPLTYSNTWYLMRKIAPHERVMSKLNRLLSITELLVIDRDGTQLALQSKFKDFEDALQNYAAETHGGIRAILTRNGKDYRHGRIAAMSPGEFLKTWNNT